MSMPWNSYLLFREKKKEIRYFNYTETQELFDALLTTSKERIESISKGKLFWRAQRVQLDRSREPAYDFDGRIIDYNVVPYSSKRMRPEPEKASEGRINPKGIPCLYLATNEKTAISEARPWIGSYVTVAQFKTLRKLNIIDCSHGEIDPMNISAIDMDKLYKLKQTTPEEAIETIWHWVDKEFSEPVDRNDNTADYVPTQIIAELFKTNGFDGIKYKSLFNNGENLALFDINSAEQVDKGKVIQVTKVDVDFKQIHPFPFTQGNKHE